jgi:TPR repeat protein
MARFFLEKAAQSGHSIAQRMLGALLLRESEGVHASERALNWLHLADQQGDALARDVMSSLVLPVAGDDEAAAHVVNAIGRTDPLLAARLTVARRFGLTKLEALGVDLVAGVRPWGIVISHNPHIRQRRLAAGRAVPAVSSEATQAMRRATALHTNQESPSFGQTSQRQRSRSLKTLLDHFGAEESSFFAEANSTVLESLRVGSKWAYRARSVLRAALSDTN